MGWESVFPGSNQMRVLLEKNGAAGQLPQYYIPEIGVAAGWGSVFNITRKNRQTAAGLISDVITSLIHSNHVESQRVILSLTAPETLR